MRGSFRAGNLARELGVASDVETEQLQQSGAAAEAQHGRHLRVQTTSIWGKFRVEFVRKWAETGVGRCVTISRALQRDASPWLSSEPLSIATKSERLWKLSRPKCSSRERNANRWTVVGRRPPRRPRRRRCWRRRSARSFQRSRSPRAAPLPPPWRPRPPAPRRQGSRICCFLKKRQYLGCTMCVLQNAIRIEPHRWSRRVAPFESRRNLNSDSSKRDSPAPASRLLPLQLDLERLASHLTPLRPHHLRVPQVGEEHTSPNFFFFWLAGAQNE